MIPYDKQELRLSQMLRGLAGVAALLCLAGLVGAYFGPSTAFLVQPPWVSNTVAGLGVLAFLAWFAAADVRRFRSMAHLLVAATAIGAATFVALLWSPHAAGQTIALLIAAGGAGGIMLLLAWLLQRAQALPPVLPWMTEKPLTLAERIGQVVFGVFGLSSLLFAAGLLALGFIGPTTQFFTQPLFLGGSTVKIALLGLLALLAVARIRRNTDMVTILVLGHVVSFIAAVLSLLGVVRFGEVAVTFFGVTVTTHQVMTGVVISDAAIIVAFTALKLAMDRARLDHLGYLAPFQFRTIEALADSVIDEQAREKVASHLVALRLDGYLSSFPSNRLALTRLAVIGLELLPLPWLLPPLSILSPAARRAFIDHLYKQDLAPRQGRRPLRDLLLDQVHAAIRIGMQGVYLGYYSDPRVHQDIGYVPFSRRYADYARIERVRPYPPLAVTTPADVRREGLDVIRGADVVVIGSGAAGSILAEQLLAQGRDVLLLERGLNVRPDEFTEDEVQMVGRLYADGALQTTQSYRFQILQGSCVGGTTVVNNAVCFDTPEWVLEHWNDPLGPNAGIDVAAFRASQQAVRQRLRIRSIKDSSRTRPWQDVLNPGDRVIEAGVRKIGLKPGDEFDVVSANIDDCLGCGYCNIGCAFGRKLSMLDEVLPKAQHLHGPDRFRIFSEAEVVKLDGNGRAITEIVARLRDGRELRIQNPKTVVVSAGTVASSWLLMRSGIGHGELPVGRHLGFNMGSPLHGYWPASNGQHLDSYAGLQIAHYLKLAEHRGFVYETWFNPPVAQALAMPGWLESHTLNMRRYRDLSAVGVLVGTEPTAHVTPALILRGAPDVVYTPSQRDLDTLLGALMILGRVMFAGGAEVVMATAASYRYEDFQEAVFRGPEDLEKLAKLVKTDRDIILGTGHPQGGNAISRTRGQDRGVVDPEFKVYGVDNLYVCDASVFPSPTTVNPQLTVMSMAHYAASRIQ
jgi:choline dehydrogenase-like flavoprotein